MVGMISDVVAPAAARRPAAEARAGRALAATALVLGVVLVALAAPRFAASLHLGGLSPGWLLKVEVEAESLSPSDLAHASSALVGAMRWDHDARYAAALASAKLIEAGRAKDRAGAEPLLRHAADAARAAVSVSPAHPYAWALLAQALHLLDPDDPAVVRALRQSIVTAPYEPRQLEPRVDLAGRHWEQLDPRTKALAAMQIVTLAQRRPDRLAWFAHQGRSLGAYREALASTPALRAAFDRAYVAAGGR
jgi:hypothetical protein